MEPLKIPFALKAGKIVAPSDCIQNGRACGATCMGCNQPLIKRKRKGAREHFAHHTEGGCSLETALHQAAKQIISEATHIQIPGKDKAFPITFPNGICAESILWGVAWQEIWGNIEKPSEPENIKIDACIQEHDATISNGQIIPDCQITTGNQTLNIEILVTNRDLENKVWKYTNARQDALEINLSNVPKENWTLETLRDLVLNDISLKTWISSPQTRAVSKIVAHARKEINSLEGYKCNTQYGDRIIQTKGAAFWFALGKKLEGVQSIRTSHIRKPTETIRMEWLKNGNGNSGVTRVWMIYPKGQGKPPENSPHEKLCVEYNPEIPWEIWLRRNARNLIPAKLELCPTCKNPHIRLETEPPTNCQCGSTAINYPSDFLTEEDWRHAPPAAIELLYKYLPEQAKP